jgi:ElaA protein
MSDVRARAKDAPAPTDLVLHEAALDDLDARTLYALLRLRTDVFVVEQRCPYAELDGRDLEPATRHLWLSPPDDRCDVRAYLRTLADPGGVLRIGRVCTAPGSRGAGLSGLLVQSALRQKAETFVLDAQSYLTGFYARYGFVPTGPEYIEDGIPHVPMSRP